MYTAEHRPRPAALVLGLTLLESDRSFLRFAESAFTSVVAHLAVILSAVAVTHDSPKVPTDEREARVFFLLPPDRVDVRLRQTETIQWGKLGADIADGKDLAMPARPGLWTSRPSAPGARGREAVRGARLPSARRLRSFPTRSGACSRWMRPWSATPGAPRRSTPPS